MIGRRFTVGALVFLSVAFASGLPVGDVLMIEPGTDTAVVESTIREVRAALPPESKDLAGEGSKKAFIRTYGDGKDDENTQGYLKRTEDKGSDGYKHYDSYHKKDGDKYGYEKHSQYGYGEHQDTDASDKSERYAKADGKGKGKKNEKDGSETKTTYQVIEDGEIDSDGDSGHYVADSGHYSEGGESGGFQGGEGESYHGGGGESGSYSTGGGESASYSTGGGDSGSYSGGYSEGGDGSSGHYTAASDGEGDGESEHYSEEGDEDY